MWDSNAGIGREGNKFFAVTTFLQNLKPHVAAAYKLSVTDWQTKDWKTTINKIMALHSSELFTYNKPASSPKQMVQYVQQDSGQQRNGNNKKRRRGNCHKCGKAGHWARECRSGCCQNRSNNQNQGHQTWDPPQAAPPALPPPQLNRLLMCNMHNITIKHRDAMGDRIRATISHSSSCNSTFY